MSVRFRKYMLLALLLLVPLQGLAATLHALSCAGHEEHAASAAHVHGDTDRGGAHHHPDGSTGGGGDHGGQSCCHAFSAVPVHLLAATRDEPTVFSARAIAPTRSVVLERPQRPPRA